MSTRQAPLIFEHDDMLETWRDCRVCRRRTPALLTDDGVICSRCRSKTTWTRRGPAATTNANAEGVA